MNGQAWTLRASVMGPPMAYGSKRGFYNPKLKRVVLVNVNYKNLRTWQDALRSSMLATSVPPNYEGLLLVPVRLVLKILMQRPKSHYRKDGTLTTPAKRNPYPTGKPDGDKVARAVADCGTGIWYRDDSQVVHWEIRKLWADDGPPRTVVEVEPMGEP